MNTTQTKTVELGKVYVSGNTLAPSRDRALAIVPWSQVSSRGQRTWRTICYWMTEEQHAAREYVKHTGQKFAEYTPRDVYEATRYETVDAMIEAYRRPSA